MISHHIFPNIFPKKWRLFICLSLAVVIACIWTQETALAETTIDFTEINPQIWLKQVLQWIDSQGAIGAIAFILVYIIATVAFLPGSLLTLGAGVIFDVGLGSVYVFIGATLGATAAFLVGRYLARDWVVKKISGNKKFAAIDQAVGNAGLKIVLLTRLSPIFPFNLLNYAFGITGVSFSDYVIGSIGMIPGTIMYVYIGSLATSLAMLDTATPSGNSSIQLAMKIFGFVATVLVTIYITKLAKKALDAEGL
ncbi:hypothetical protein B6N60_04031 [Richelia sinica FACHB-800]|uniref:TVP38/TMEM64 family membrane protein n=1 Tax=Richelia sinica FACHB-800 TaxID=1357546 RepID=A0A975Y6I6_9NOST|nr:TVP38/TMEM64 family protein [Richelia sinica]MBD2664767.1 TVP38/TMEM64 family protein [Richelia sinica FACHB-800]QXE25317.1 hypothetical protein B6N60_04031 [Richelia sinica FACHB-800]